MKRKHLLIGSLCLIFSLLVVSVGSATSLVANQEGVTILPNAPDYYWWYGCSPTSAGMMMGYYDINGYNGLRYDNLVPGVDAELSTYGLPGAAANQMIASDGHVADFYTGYGNSGDDPNPGTTREFDSLADFMGTSQDSVGNSDGGTTFWYYTNGSRLYAYELEGFGLQDQSGMYGLWEYLVYAGYGAGNITEQNIYNQYIDTLGLADGFTWNDYMAEIDAGRVVMIHVQGHSMFGYGYDAQTQEILLHDTWNAGEHRMLWGGSYPYGEQGLDFYAVTVFVPTGGTNPIPEPGTLLLLGFGLLGLFPVARKRIRK